MGKVPERAHTVALSGHFGENNVGDDLLLLALVTNLCAMPGVGELVVFTAGVGNSSALLAREGVPQEVVSFVYSGRWGILEPGEGPARGLRWLRLSFAGLKRADLHLIGPGTIIKDSTSPFFLLFWMFRAFVSLVLGRPFAFIGIGVGALRYAHSRLLVKWLMNRAVFVTTRDSRSQEELALLGVHRPPVSSFPDLSFATAPPVVAAAGGEGGIVKVGVNFRKFGVKHFPEETLRRYEAAVGTFLAALPEQVEVVFYSFCDEHHQSDLAMSDTLRERGYRFRVCAYGTLGRLRDDIASCDAFVGSRFHSVLLAIQAGVPTIGLSYERKTVNFMTDAGLTDFALDIAEMAPERLLSAWDRLVAARAGYRERLTQTGSAMRTESRRHFEQVASALSRTECRK